MVEPDDEPESGPEPKPDPERKPSRRRVRPNLPRGKKGERKRRKQEGRASKTSAQNDPKRQEGFGGIQDWRDRLAEDRKALLLDDSSSSDKSPLTEPSSHFYGQAQSIKESGRNTSGEAIVVNNLAYEFGIDVDAVKAERRRVLSGQKSKVFNGLAEQLKQHKKALRQEERKSQKDALDEQRKHDAKMKKTAAAQHEKRILEVKEDGGREKVTSDATVEPSNTEEPSPTPFSEEDQSEPSPTAIDEGETSVQHAAEETHSEADVDLSESEHEDGEQLSPQDELESEAHSTAEELEEIASPELDATIPSAAEESVGEPETEDAVLPIFRKIMREEPDPLACIHRLLRDEHNLSKEKISTLIAHEGAVYSMCQSMNEKTFLTFIHSIGVQPPMEENSEPWVHLVDAIEDSQITDRQREEVHQLLTKKQGKKNARVTAIAVLRHFHPDLFDKWWGHETIPDFAREKYAHDHQFFLKAKAPTETLDQARMLLCALALEKPKIVAKEFTFAKHRSGRIHEDRTEAWLKQAGVEVAYITEAEIRESAGKKYGQKRIQKWATPDILLEKPIQISDNGQHIHWIDAKKVFVDPALAPEPVVEKICAQMKKYVAAYGPGLIVWGKPFSEEWNDAMKGAVLHVKI